ncbi:MAG: carboxy-S-adenosyl-L-methionine synthase CmoA [Kangiellaceae bacterium]|nr:carboxy-S-adenosyl-L-methionine synthase CmoA [Kangiellaceae bacterium]
MVDSNNDNLFAQPVIQSPFQFDDKVAAVFPDMIKRSVPGYSHVLHNIQLLASRFIQPNSKCYDLGCSLGAVCLAMSYGNHRSGVEIIGVDNSSAMIEQCQNNIDSFKHTTPITLLSDDISQITCENASMVVLNYTLQFIDPSLRIQLLKSIFDAMLPGGILVISEKLIFRDANINKLMIDLHHQFKRENGYSELEISQKRNALENVLVPETMEAQLKRLQDIGFDQVSCWNQQLNFASFIAVKS